MVANTPRLEYVIGRNRTCYLNRYFRESSNSGERDDRACHIQFSHASFHVYLRFPFLFHKNSRDLAYKEVVFDKLKRLGIPYLFFTFFTFAVKFIFSPFMKRPGRIVFTTIYRQFSISRLQPVERNVVRRHTLYHHATYLC